MSMLRNVMLKVNAGSAKPGPAIGQALGPLGLNMSDFTKKFNADSAHIVLDTPCPVRLTAYSDRTFKFKILTPSTSYLIKKCLRLPPAGKKADGKGSKKPGSEILGWISPQEIYEIAKIKLKDRPDDTLLNVCKGVAGTANSMGVEVSTGEYEEVVV